MVKNYECASSMPTVVRLRCAATASAVWLVFLPIAMVIHLDENGEWRQWLELSSPNFVRMDRSGSIWDLHFSILMTFQQLFLREAPHFLRERSILMAAGFNWLP
jgi:hypothetical protein